MDVKVKNTKDEQEAKTPKTHASREKLTQHKSPIILIIVGLFIVLTLGFVLGRYSSNSNEEVKKTNSFDQASSPFYSLIGKIQSVNDGQIVIDTSKGERKTVVIDENTKITKKTDILKPSDLKVDQKVTIILKQDSSSSDKPVAMRIVISSKQQ